MSDSNDTGTQTLLANVRSSAPLPAHVRQVANSAEDAALRGATFEQILQLLRRLSVDDFGLVMWSMPNDHWPGLSAVLPPMASPEVQKRWTGYAGVELLRNTLWFPRLMDGLSWRHRGSGVSGASVLDVGCGYGRLVRLMYYYTDPSNITGVDAWSKSLELCGSLPGTFLLVDAVPAEYPVRTTVDVAFAFSVLTHLSEVAARAVLAAVRPCLGVNGIFVATIRPVEFWRFLEGRNPRGVAHTMEHAHALRGFAYTPHSASSPHYGDTSISLEYLADLGEWTLLGYDRSLSDPYQIAVVLRHRQ
jgi:SAM-dependent methyltransferase